MESSPFTILATGSAGVGKSCFLNYLIQSDNDASKNIVFKSRTGANHCTNELKSYTGNIYGTSCKANFIDTQGGLSINMPLSSWIEKIQAGTSTLDCLMWVINTIPVRMILVGMKVL